MSAELLLSPQPISRNKHFESFTDQHTRGAFALYRRLRALARELEQALAEGGYAVVSHATRAGVPNVELLLVTTRARRRSFFERDAFEVLLRHPAAARALTALQTRAPQRGAS